jgi:hypothetical protein
MVFQRGLAAVAVLAMLTQCDLTQQPPLASPQVATVAQGEQSDEKPQIVGTWLCSAVRTANNTTTHFPLTYTFHQDGTFTYSSGSLVSVFGFTSRGNGGGQWDKTGPETYKFKAVEILYKNGDGAGRFYVESELLFNRQDDTLCSGRSACPGQRTKARLTSFTPSTYPQESLIFDVCTVNSMCTRLTDSFVSPTATCQ